MLYQTVLDSLLFFDSATVVSLNICVNEHAVTESFIPALVTPTCNAKLKWRCSIVYRINILGGKKIWPGTLSTLACGTSCDLIIANAKGSCETRQIAGMCIPVSGSSIIHFPRVARLLFH